MRARCRAAGLTGLPLVIDADLTIDLGRNRVVLRGTEAALTGHEHRLLYHLVSNAGRLMPYEALLARVWGPEYRGEGHYVRLYVSYLRAKIEPDSRHPKYILTEKGLGYRFAELGTRRYSSGRSRHSIHHAFIPGKNHQRCRHKGASSELFLRSTNQVPASFQRHPPILAFREGGTGRSPCRWPRTAGITTREGDG